MCWLSWSHLLAGCFARSLFFSISFCFVFQTWIFLPTDFHRGFFFFFSNGFVQRKKYFHRSWRRESRCAIIKGKEFIGVAWRMREQVCVTMDWRKYLIFTKACGGTCREEFSIAESWWRYWKKFSFPMKLFRLNEWIMMMIRIVKCQDEGEICFKTFESNFWIFMNQKKIWSGCRSLWVDWKSLTKNAFFLVIKAFS